LWGLASFIEKHIERDFERRRNSIQRVNVWNSIAVLYFGEVALQ
jgi:hypothetical protein